MIGAGDAAHCILTTNGLWAEGHSPPGGGVIAVLRGDEAVFAGDDVLYEIEDQCQAVHGILQNRLFRPEDPYYDGLAFLPIWVLDAGNDSDLACSRSHLQEWLGPILSGSEPLGGPRCTREKLLRYLYHADCRALVMSLQNRAQETKLEFIDFFRVLASLDVDAMFRRPDQSSSQREDTVRWLSGGSANRVFSVLTSAVVKLYSLLDLVTKVAEEVRMLPESFQSYPRLRSSGLLYGKGRAPELEPVSPSLPSFKWLIGLRNELIHQGGWEPSPKVYYRIQAGRVTEKWVLLPDTDSEGNLETFRNRRRFFGREHRANDLLPRMALATWTGVRDVLREVVKRNATEAAPPLTSNRGGG